MIRSADLLARDAPIANNDSMIVQQNSAAVTVNILNNDTDVDDDVLSIGAFSYTGQGQVVISSQQLTYTPAVGFSGNDSINYIVTDGVLTDEARLSIQVNSGTPTTEDSGGGSMWLLSLLSFLCFFIRSVNHSLCRDDNE